MLGCKLAALYVSGLYQRSWETFGLRDLAAVVRGVGMGSLLSVLTVAYLYRVEGFSRVVFVLDALLLAMAIVATRASFRTMNLVAAARNKRSRRVLVYGAGAVRPDAGARDARQRALEHEPGRVHRRRPDEGAPLDRGRAGARHARRARGRRCAATPWTRWC